MRVSVPGDWMKGMIDHFGINCADLDAAKAFYDGVLGTLGYGRVLDFGVAVGYGPAGKPDFWIGSYDGQPATQREVHIAFQVPSKEAVDAFYAKALELGATSLHEVVRRRPQARRAARYAYTWRSTQLMRGAALFCLGMQCSQPAWHMPPITSRSPQPRLKARVAPPPNGRSKKRRGAPSARIATSVGRSLGM